jgi:dihydroceramidase
MTGIGAYFYLTWGIWLRHCLNDKHDDYELIWPRVATSVPVVVRKRKQTGGVQIGNGKKNA